MAWDSKNRNDLPPKPLIYRQCHDNIRRCELNLTSLQYLWSCLGCGRRLVVFLPSSTLVESVPVEEISIDARTTHHSSGCYASTTSRFAGELRIIKKDPPNGWTAGRSQAGTISGKTDTNFKLKMTEVSSAADTSIQQSPKTTHFCLKNVDKHRETQTG